MRLEELSELQQISADYERALVRQPAFHPDRFDYRQEGNQSVIPRYNEERVFAGKRWQDAFSEREALADPETVALLTKALQQTFATLKPLSSLSLYILLSGETDLSQAGKIEGGSNVSVNSVGIRQLYLMKKVLDPFPITGCYTSDLSHALETAAIYMEGRQGPIYRDARLRERNFGEWQGRLAEDFKRAHPKSKRPK